MSESPQTSSLQSFGEDWSTSFSSVLSQMVGAPVSGSCADSVPAQPLSPEALAAAVSCRFLCGGTLKGELLALAETSAALQLAQVFMSEKPDPAAEFSDTLRDAFAELLRQVAGQTATAWKQRGGSEAAISFHSAVEPPFAPERESALRLSSDKFSEVSLRLFLSAELCASLNSVPVAAAPPVLPRPSPGPAPERALPAAERPAEPFVPVAEPVPGLVPSALPSNLDLLLDVELEATIRFGERELPLREIFGLMPGTVVELNQMVNEPAELLVAGRLVARGEVVVVDGNFGLQITEVVSRAQRAQLVPLG